MKSFKSNKSLIRDSHLSNKNCLNDFNYLITEVKKNLFHTTSLQDALYWGKLLGELYVNNHGIYYRDDEIEDYCINSFGKKYQTCVLQEQTNNEVHLISNVLKSGGHTRLLETLIHFRGEGDVFIAKPTYKDNIYLTLPTESTIISSFKNWSLCEMIETLSSYKRIFLHISPEDITSSFCIGVIKGIRPAIQIVLINHADHVFSFAWQYADKILEVSLFGWMLTKEYRNKTSSYLGIPLNNIDLKKTKKLNINKLNIISGAAASKYKPKRDMSLPNVLMKLMSLNKTCSILVIGPNLKTNWWWWLVKIRHPYRLKIKKLLPYSEYEQELKIATIYLDSYPMTGGTAFPQARAKSLNIIGLKKNSFGYTPLDEIRCSTENELIQTLSSQNRLDSLFLKNNDLSLLSLAKYAHSKNDITRRLEIILNTEKVLKPIYSSKNKLDLDFYKKNWLNENKVFISVFNVLELLNRNEKNIQYIISLILDNNSLIFYFKLKIQRIKIWFQYLY